MLLEKQDDNVLLNLKKCGKCSNIIELFEVPIEGSSYDSMLYQVLQDKDKSMKVKFQEFKVMCPRCRDAQEGITFIKLGEDDLSLLNDTPLSQVYVTISNV